jgi:hypothetical protein
MQRLPRVMPAIVPTCLQRLALGLALLWGGVAPGAWAQSSEAFCTLFEAKKNGDYLYLEADNSLQGASRRSLEEQTSVGVSAIKGALARRLSAEASQQSVRWSGAEVRGPLACNGFKVLIVKVDTRTVKVGAAEAAAVVTEPKEELVEAAMVRQLSGRANRDDLALLRDFYASQGNLLLAKKMTEEMLTIQLK